MSWIKRTFFRRALLGAVFFLLTGFLLGSCLAVEAEFDLSDENALELTMRYRMNSALWDLGVFDEDSPERAVPVARRDAQETALRYSDVTLEEYRLERTGEEVVIITRFRAGSMESLQRLWGDAAGAPIAIRTDPHGVTVPLVSASPPMDTEQRALFQEVFADRRARVTVHAPGEISDATVAGLALDDPGKYEGRRYELTVPMYDLLAGEDAVVLRLTW